MYGLDWEKGFWHRVECGLKSSNHGVLYNFLFELSLFLNMVVVIYKPLNEMMLQFDGMYKI